MHPCCWCDVDMHNLNKKGNQRTFASLLKLYNDYLNANVDRSKAKDFGNVIHASIIDDQNEEMITPVIHKVPPPELHFLLDPTQHLCDELTKRWSGCKSWLTSIHVKKADYFGGTFEGNDCRKMLKNIEKLENICPDMFRGYVDTFKKFNEVVSS